MRKIGKHLRGHFVAYLALFFALCGTSFAAVSVALPRNSVGSLQIRNGAIKKVDINGSTITALKGQRGLRGLQGPKGDKGADLTIATTLQPGQTETGVYGAWGRSATAGNYLADSVDFRIPLAADLPLNHHAFVPQGTASGPHCAGIGKADPGYLCVYEVGHFNTTHLNEFDPTDGSDEISKLGFNIYFSFAAGDPAGAWSYGEWAVTPPPGG